MILPRIRNNRLQKHPQIDQIAFLDIQSNERKILVWLRSDLYHIAILSMSRSMSYSHCKDALDFCPRSNYGKASCCILDFGKPPLGFRVKFRNRSTKACCILCFGKRALVRRKKSHKQSKKTCCIHCFGKTSLARRTKHCNQSKSFSCTCYKTS